MSPPAEPARILKPESDSGQAALGVGQPEGATNVHAAMFVFMVALAHELGLRDVRAVAILLTLFGNDRSIPDQPGVSVQFLAYRMGSTGTDEVVRHLIRSLQAQNLVERCGRTQRTHLFRLAPEAEQKLQRLLAVFGQHH